MKISIRITRGLVLTSLRDGDGLGGKDSSHSSLIHQKT
jgi:hypothetical protein